VSKLLVLCIFIGLTFANKQERDGGLKERLGAKLEATTSVIEQNTCIDDTGSDSAGNKSVWVRTDLVLDTKYINVGQCPIILDKRSGTVTGQMISKSQQDAIAKKYEYKSILEIMTLSPKPREEGDTPSEAFAILKPGESYEGKSMTRLLMKYPDEYSVFASDLHFLSLGLWTTSGTLHQSNDLDDLRTRWQTLGYLWAEGITTQPIPLQFLKLKDIGKCKPNTTR
jgi:hypothetical protein